MSRRAGSSTAGGRRPAGVAILAGLAVVVLVVAAGRDAVVTGRAMAVPVAPPPRAGDCVLQAPSAAEGFDDNARDALPSIPTGPCDGPRYGEVVSTGPGSGVPAAFSSGLWERCWSSAEAYVGLAAESNGALRQQATSMGTALIGPDERQLAVGQDWSACLVTFASTASTASTASFDGSDGPAVLDHSVRGAWQRDPGLFSICLDGGDVSYPLNCAAPHRYEPISFWTGDPAQSGASAERDCRKDAVAAIGGSRPLDAGELTIEVTYSRWDDGTGQLIIGPEAITDDGSEYWVDCRLTPADPGRRLVGPLRGLGDAPVPLG